MAALEEIPEGVVKVTDLVAEISAASNEQAQGISQISQGLGQIDQVTQQNTANAEESAAASEELSGQANELRQMLGRFKLKQQGLGSYNLAANTPTHSEQAKAANSPTTTSTEVINSNCRTNPE